mgnify:FL=1
MHTTLHYRAAKPADIAECIDIRGKTRENAVTAARLSEMGITLQSWGDQVKSGALPGVVCIANGAIAGYCFCDRSSGEIVVLALLPAFENQGIGRALLAQAVAILAAQGHTRLHLGCSSDHSSRSYGFYRHLGWRTTHAFDENHDEILEFYTSARAGA